MEGPPQRQIRLLRSTKLVAMTTDQKKLVASRTFTLFIISTQFLAKKRRWISKVE